MARILFIIVILCAVAACPARAQNFRVQIAAFADSVPASYFRDRGVDRYLVSVDQLGLYRYLAGSFRTYEEAEVIVKTLVDRGFVHATVIDLEAQRVLSGAHCPYQRTAQLFGQDPNADATVRNIYFDSGSAQLTAEARTELDRIAVKMRENAALKLRVLGHSDAVGSAQANIEIATERARTARNYLIDVRGIAADRMYLKVFGEAEPAAANQDDYGRDLPEERKWNRRVVLVLFEE